MYRCDKSYKFSCGGETLDALVGVGSEEIARWPDAEPHGLLELVVVESAFPHELSRLPALSKT